MTREAATGRLLGQLEGTGGAVHLDCRQAMTVTPRLPVHPGVWDLFGHTYARWDGRSPGAAGPDVPPTARVDSRARAVELARRAGGQQAAEMVVRARRGSKFDPELCDLYFSCAAKLFGGLAGSTRWDVFLDTRRGPEITVGPDDIVRNVQTRPVTAAGTVRPITRARGSAAPTYTTPS